MAFWGIYTLARLAGLAVETWLHYYARKEHGKREDPCDLRIRGKREEGGYQERGREDPEVDHALEEVGPVVGKVVAAIGRVGLRLRGARCVGVPKDRMRRCVDLRARYRGERALLEVKWTGGRRARARRAAVLHLPKLRGLLDGGRWCGPHPRAGKRAQARYIGILCVCKGAWRLELWDLHSDNAEADVTHEGRIVFRPSGYARRKAAAARKPDADPDPASEGSSDGSDDAESSSDAGSDAPSEGSWMSDAPSGGETSSSNGSC